MRPPQKYRTEMMVAKSRVLSVQLLKYGQILDIFR